MEISMWQVLFLGNIKGEIIREPNANITINILKIKSVEVGLLLLKPLWTKHLFIILSLWLQSNSLVECYIYNNIETVLRTLFHLIMDRSYMAMNNAFPNYLLDTIQYENKWWIKRTFLYSKKSTKPCNFLLNLTLTE